MELINEKNFKENTSKGLVVVDFFANWCGPCRMLSPILEEVQEELGDKVKIYKVNVDEEENLSRQFGIMSIPCLFFFKNGEVADKQIGLVSKDVLISKIENVAK